MNNLDHISESLERFLGLKKLKFIDADPECGMEEIQIRYPGWKNSDPG
jgi:hypothetical protein